MKKNTALLVATHIPVWLVIATLLVIRKTWSMLKKYGVASAAHTPLIVAADPKLFDLDSFEHIGGPRDLSKIFESNKLVK